MDDKVIKGHLGSIEVEEDALLLRHAKLSPVGILYKNIGTPRRIPLQALGGVKLRRATRLNDGWITIGIGGEAKDLTKSFASQDPGRYSLGMAQF